MTDSQLLSETLNVLEWQRLCDHLATFAGTKIGAVACRHLDPWQSRSATERWLEQTAEAIRVEQSLAGGLSLQGIFDLLIYLERATRGGILRAQELYQIASTLGTARRVRRILDEHSDLPQLQDLIDPIRTYPEIEQEIYRCVDESGEIKDSASETLFQLRGRIRDQRSQVQQKLHRLMSEHSNAIQESVIKIREGRYSLAIKATHRDVIRGLVHDSSASGATLYVEPYSVVDFNNQLRQLLSQAQREEERILQDLSGQIGAVAEDLERLQAVMVELDQALARARYSLWVQGNRPQFRESGLVLRQVRHPLLLWQSQHDQQTVIPVDFTLRSKIRVVVITGPNTGGKTVTLKTLGLLVLMAKAGIYLPAREPVEVPWFDWVFADIGDEQSLQQSLSTFSGHIRRISRILEALNPRFENLKDLTDPPIQSEDPEDPEGLESSDHGSREDHSEGIPVHHQIMSENPSGSPDSRSSDSGSSGSALVLLDEVGAGTDPTEGAALAAALLEYLGHHTQLTMATTHYGELKSLKYQHDFVENASVEFDEITLAPTYRLLWGIPGRSNALTIARRLNLHPTVLDQAQSKLEGHTSHVDTVIMGMEQQRSELETKVRQAEVLHQELETLRQDMEQRHQRLKEQEAELQRQKTTAIQQAIASARGEVAAVIRRLQKGEDLPKAQAAQQATQALDQLEQRHKPPEPPPIETEFYPQIGDRVRLPEIGQVGEVIESEGEAFVVRSGILKFTVNLRQLAPIDDHQAKQRQRLKPVPSTAPSKLPPVTIRTSQNTFDLRGKNVADAEQLLEKVLTEVGSGPIWLIHGHGTGKLRAGVHSFLRSHPRVSRFTAADQEDGGTGVTVAYVQ